MVIVVGISFNLIIIRVDSTAAATSSSYSVQSHNNPMSISLHLMRRNEPPAPPPSRGLEVSIHQDVEVDVVSEMVMIPVTQIGCLTMGKKWDESERINTREVGKSWQACRRAGTPPPPPPPPPPLRC